MPTSSSSPESNPETSGSLRELLSKVIIKPATSESPQVEQTDAPSHSRAPLMRRRHFVIGASLLGGGLLVPGLAGLLRGHQEGASPVAAAEARPRQAVADLEGILETDGLDWQDMPNGRWKKADIAPLSTPDSESRWEKILIVSPDDPKKVPVNPSAIPASGISNSISTFRLQEPKEVIETRGKTYIGAKLSFRTPDGQAKGGLWIGNDAQMSSGFLKRLQLDTEQGILMLRYLDGARYPGDFKMKQPIGQISSNPGEVDLNVGLSINAAGDEVQVFLGGFQSDVIKLTSPIYHPDANMPRILSGEIAATGQTVTTINKFVVARTKAA